MNNENLEKIKQLCDVEVPYNEVCSIHANALGEIQEAAERMAEEIETKDGALTFALLEVARLKAELEKREEVVRCEDCIWNDGACDQEINYSAIDEVDLLSYCSAGQRR